ncbi:MAG: hypothetical protein Q9P01_08410, partial [Anaerolineae bacterium]|nr:hypothetical protein [Anaerolineae bacterium]
MMPMWMPMEIITYRLYGPVNNSWVELTGTLSSWRVKSAPCTVVTCAALLQLLKLKCDSTRHCAVL